MKKFVRGMSLFLATVLSVGVFAACDSSEKEADKEEKKIPTIEEVLKVFKETENGKFEMKVTSSATESGVTVSMDVDMSIEAADNLAYMVTSMKMTSSGQTLADESVEMYMKQSDDKITYYSKDETTGKWTENSGEVDQGSAESTAEAYKELFNAEYYGEFDKETGRYTMKEDQKVTIKVNGINAEFSDAYIEYKDGSYTLFTKYTAAGADCTLTLKYSNIGKVSVTLPEGIEG